MPRAKPGDAVLVHYTGLLDDGNVFDSSLDGDPLFFTIGQGKMIAAVENAVVGMIPGEFKSVFIPHPRAYGPWRDDMVAEIERARLPDDIEIEVGAELHLEAPGREPLPLQIIEVGAATVTVDANHPLAGHDLTFELKLVEIVRDGPPRRA